MAVVSGKCCSFQVHFKVHSLNAINCIAMYCVFPVRAPLRRRDAVAECIQRINYQTLLGGIEMDANDGELRVKTVLTSDAATIADDVLDYLLTATMDTANRYMEPILAICFGNAAPELVIEMAERCSKSELQ
jgi:hypothetical protein